MIQRNNGMCMRGEGIGMSREIRAITTPVIPQWNCELLFKILDNINDVALVIDSDTTIVYANDAYLRHLGVPVSKVLGRRLDIIEPGSPTIKCLKSGQPRQGTGYVESLNIHVVGNSFPLYNNEEEIVGAVSIFKNITEIVELSRKLKQTQGVADYLREQLEQRENIPASFKEYIGQNPHIKETLALAAKVARTDSTVLILGESGVGKEVLARAIYNGSKRKDKPFIKVNCAAIPENLIESELFGFEDGAFTGAKKGGKLGKFELAHGGTIFLDEIGDMSPTTQAKVLRVLQEKEIERVGGTKSIRVDIRVIAATNRDLEGMIKRGDFRRDLYYRLNIVPLRLLPMRERKDDVLRLAYTFLKQHSKEMERELTLSPQVVKFFHEYDWPGNIRELQNVIEHASIVCNGTVVELHHLPKHILPLSDEEPQSQENPYDMKEVISRLEKELILSALSNYNNNRTKAMKALGISRRAFYEKLRKYGIEDKEAELI